MTYTTLKDDFIGSFEFDNIFINIKQEINIAIFRKFTDTDEIFSD